MVMRREVFKLIAATVVWIMKPKLATAASIPPATEAALRTSSLIYVATQRKNGQRSSIAPIWFFYEDNKIFFTTAPTSWKAKRIKRGSPLYIWVGSEDGPFLNGKAEPITDGAFIDKMGAAYSNKYWIAWAGLFRPRSERVASGKTNAYLVTVSEGTPPAA